MSSLIDFDPDDLITPSNYGLSGQPHEIWSQLRKHSPVHRIESSSHPPFYAITRHADIMNISNKPNVFSNGEGPMMLDKPTTARRDANPDEFGQMRTIIEMDPPEHREFRKVASGFFTPRSIHRLDEIVSECARAQVDKLGQEGECDFDLSLPGPRLHPIVFNGRVCTETKQHYHGFCRRDYLWQMGHGDGEVVPLGMPLFLVV